MYDLSELHIPMSQSIPKLFQPITVGDVTLAHRVVLAPLTRCRANSQHVHGDLAVEYYSQRASVPGTLLITEATYIAPQSVGHFLGPTIPGVWSDEQVAAWKRVGLMLFISYLNCVRQD